MRRLLAATLLATLVLPGCLGVWGANADADWTAWTRGPFTFHVATRDVAGFAGLESQTLADADSLGRALHATLQGPIDVWAYLPQPPGAEIDLPAWPPGLLGGDASDAIRLSTLHELAHVFQFRWGRRRGSRRGSSKGARRWRGSTTRRARPRRSAPTPS